MINEIGGLLDRLVIFFHMPLELVLGQQGMVSDYCNGTYVL